MEGDDPAVAHPVLGAERFVAVEAVLDIAVGREDFCAWFAAVPLERILPAHGLIAATTHTTPIRGVWNEPGARRRVHQADGSSAVEEVLSRGDDGGFAYVVWGFRPPLGRLAGYALGRFGFADVAGGVRVSWRYAFAARKLWALPGLWVLARFMFLPFMRAALARAKMVAEAEK